MSETKKKKGKGCLIAIAIFVIIGIIGAIFDDGVDENTEEKVVKKEIVELKKWDEMNLEEHKEAVKGFIYSKSDVYSNLRYRLRLVVVPFLQTQVKYPETIEFKSIWDENKWVAYDDSDADIINSKKITVEDYDKGLLNVSVPFRSQNKIGIKVRSLLKIKIQYNGETYTVKSIDWN